MLTKNSKLKNGSIKMKDQKEEKKEKYMKSSETMASDKKMSKKEKKSKKKDKNQDKAFEPKSMNQRRYRTSASKTNTKNTDKTKKKKKKKTSILLPRSSNDVIRCFFEDYDTETNLFRIGENLYSMCYEYEDISFTKADAEEALDILLKWRDYINSLNEDIHMQVVNANTPVVTKGFKERYKIHFDENKLSDNEIMVAEELNDVIERTIGNKPVTLITKRYLVLTIKSDSYASAASALSDVERGAAQKFREVDSSLRPVGCEERLEFLYDLFHLKTHTAEGVKDVEEEALNRKDSTGNLYSVYDVIAPKYINLREDDLIEIHDSNEPDSPQKFIRCLCVDKLPTSMTPRFYNKITSIENVNCIVTQNIQPVNNGKFLKMVRRQITSMKAERLGKVKRAHKNGYDYGLVRDENLEDRLDRAEELRNDLLKNNQKIFQTNILVAVIANTYEELTNATTKILQISAELVVDMKTVKWQQLEALINIVPFGHNTLSNFQRELTSDATALNVPFNSKDLMDEQGLFFGTNLVSKQGVWCDRRKLLNGNGCVLATSGAGKSFNVKLQIEQIQVKYPEDDIIIIDPQGEYQPIIQDFGGQTIKISSNTDTYINPFDTDLNYGLSDDEVSDPVKEKTEYIIAFCESLMQGYPLTGAHKTIIDRCCRRVFEGYEMSNFQDQSLAPNLPIFYEELQKQPEPEAQSMALTLERYVQGSMNIFSHETNVHIKNRLVSFDISELPSSMQTTGYLVVLDHIMNRLAHNRSLKRNTWLFIDEFHILLQNQYSAEYIAKLYKIGRKLNAFNTIITQNIADVLHNEQGCKILNNSEFAVILKQKRLDLPDIQDIFGISSEMATYVQDPPKGQGILVFGKDKVPFYFNIDSHTYIYRLNNTNNIQIWE